ncbi:MAG: hypothetical protein ABS54_07295 [Hyphomicrobium sp. SCN 65-11]|jgi:1-acyl-sn-glycerol-3-phosphate acyltransferase|nr:MAG: hypothetical protein ABS54_07295 [Hyphomicrobium sp. SCN 65-11]
MWTTDSAETTALSRSAAQAPAFGQILGCDLPHIGAPDRVLLRGLALIASRSIVSIEGLQHILPARDPFILAANHSTMHESVLVPSMLFLHRGGKRIHFLADWNYRLVPGIGLIYRRAGVVTVLRKPARPPALNFLKGLYRHFPAPRHDARDHLVAGRSIGIFPEGQVNEDNQNLLRGRHGAARLSLETGVPVVPMGIRFPEAEAGRRTRSKSVMELVIGAPMAPEKVAEARASLSEVRAWHATIMGEIARLSNMIWTDGASRGR